MAHNLRDDKSFVTQREPAWHGLGHVVDDPTMRGRQAADLIRLPVIETEPLFYKERDGSLKELDYKVILGDREPYSVVQTSYHEIDHAVFIEAWDEVVDKPIETMGLLGKGERLFVTAELEPVDVKGDETKLFMLGFNPLTGNQATTVRVTPVRVVCQNTLEASAAHGLVKEFRVIHNSEAAKQFKKYLKDAWEGHYDKVRALREVMDILASTRLTDAQRDEVFTSTYPAIPQPQHLLAVSHKSDEALKKLAAWERENGAQLQHRERCVALYEGEGRGAQTEAAAGTAWGAWNAVAEYEDYYKRARQAESRAFGAGAQRKAIAFDTCLELAGISEVK